MPFTNLTPLEYASLADRERVHTAWLAWLLGEHSPWAPGIRGQLAASLCGRTATAVESTSSVQEWIGGDGRKRLDLLVRLEGPEGIWHVALEAKLRASEHSDQLESYDRALTVLQGPVAKVLLSLDGIAPRGGSEWLPVNFARLAELLGQSMDVAEGSDTYVVDYQAMVARLAHAAALMGLERVARSLFADEGEAEVDPADARGFTAYVSQLKLRKILQQAWMFRLGRRVRDSLGDDLPAGWSFHIDESNGAALLNFHLPMAFPGFTAGLQVQHDALKMFCHPEPYPKTATAAQTQGAAAHLNAMMEAEGLTGRPNAARNRGFTSLTIGRGPEVRDLERWAAAVEAALVATVRAVAGTQG